jgi:UDP:flavonoid glycosyltransferase YjiC (YdhE family)
MRVLVVATPMPGHLLPLVPLARSLRDAGHEVTVGTAGDALAACPADVPSVDVAPGLRLMPLMLRFAFAHPGLARKLNSGRDDPGATGLLWAPVNARMADGLAEVTGRVQPDLVVHEPFAVAAREAAARRGVPTVVVEHSLFDAREQLAGLAAAYRGGAELPPPAEFLTSAPPSLVGPRPGRPLRFVPAGAGEPAPDGLAEPGERPRVFVSRSTSGAPGRDRLMTAAVEAAAGTDFEFVLVRPDRSVSGRALPANMRTTEWVPFPAVLPAAAGIVHHGGAGTTLTALAAGTPQLLLRGPGDRRTNAELVAARGAGIAADLGGLTPAALRRLVEEPGLAEAAGQVAAEMAAMPHPDELVPVLADIAGIKS